MLRASGTSVQRNEGAYNPASRVSSHCIMCPVRLVFSLMPRCNSSLLHVMYYALAPAAPMNPTGSGLSASSLCVRSKKKARRVLEIPMDSAFGATDVGSKAGSATASDGAAHEKLLESSLSRSLRLSALSGGRTTRTAMPVVLLNRGQSESLALRNIISGLSNPRRCQAMLSSSSAGGTDWISSSVEQVRKVMRGHNVVKG